MKYSNVVSFIAFAFLTSAAPVVYVTNTVIVDQNGIIVNGQSTPTTPAAVQHKAVGTTDVEKSSSSLSRRSGSGSGSFEDGTIPCSQFPSVDHVVPLNWLGNGGWASVMSADCQTYSECKDGLYCSYACEPGYAKTQWPSTQPSTGQTLGGLYCKDGYLHKSNSDADSLCVKSKGGALLKSELSDNVALCMTDTPGSKKSVIPTNLEAGSTASLYFADDSSFKINGNTIAAEYHINNAGVSVEDGCVWGKAGSDVGNWAPLILSAGNVNGIPLITLQKNSLNNWKTAANFNIAIEAPDGCQIQGSCTYENGDFVDENHKPIDEDTCSIVIVSGFADIRFYK
ncbi:unnamed protein product [Ambrosiozyma monospora]|uniref:Unnamed protein product n=1 Tax=Ambrosiozyma monospora TaxID=43982 RepID=A0ACB5SRX6_AMBMO|nr:unnamed protein product [Ambrosiozyma monospora]